MISLPLRLRKHHGRGKNVRAGERGGILSAGYDVAIALLNSQQLLLSTYNSYKVELTEFLP